MPQENVENESLLVSRSPAFNFGLRVGVQAAMEIEEVIDRIIDVVIDAVTDLPEERGQHMNLRHMLSVRQGFMTGFQDELEGTAHPLPPEQPAAFAY